VGSPAYTNILGSIRASSDTEESGGAADEAVLNKILIKKIKKISLYILGEMAPTVIYSTTF
jgi:hypothetical protein